MFTGGCYCGAVRYQAGGGTFNHTICHCTMCRGTTGAPCVAWFSVAASNFGYTRGAPAQFRSSAHASRFFCALCGTQLAFLDDASTDEIDITVCSLDEGSAIVPLDHTFTASKVPWMALTDGLPAYQRSRSEA